jgi:hypothetical protein
VHVILPYTLAYGDIAAAAFATKGGGKMFSEK